MDLRAYLPEGSITLAPMERKIIPTGLYMEIEQGYEGQVRPRSGCAVKQGLTVINAPGTIDADYRGEVGVPLINLSTEPQTIEMVTELLRLSSLRMRKSKKLLKFLMSVK